MRMIAPGEVAPDFELASSAGGTVRLYDLLERNAAVVLAFYVLDFSPTCCGELAQFEARREEFAAMGAAIVGVSVDSVDSHREFSALQKLRFPLASDFGREVTGRYAGFYDEVAGVREVGRRAVVVVAGRSRKVAWVWTAEHPSQAPDLEDVRVAVQEIFHGD
jgi:peroxiredoxin